MFLAPPGQRQCQDEHRADEVDRRPRFAWLPVGGGGGSRTPVRKRFNKNFSGRRRLFTFPHPGVSRHTQRLGSFMIHGTRKALRTHVHHSTTPHPGPWSFRAGRPLIKQRRERRYRCSFIYKLPILRMLGASARYSGLHVPVETSTPPRRRKVRFVQDALAGILHAAPLLLLFPSDPLRWALLGFLRKFLQSPLTRNLAGGIYDILRRNRSAPPEGCKQTKSYAFTGAG